MYVLEDLALGGFLLFLEKWGKCKYRQPQNVQLHISKNNKIKEKQNLESKTARPAWRRIFR